MNGRFNGKVAIVTGAAGGIGSATVERLACEGAAVLMADIFNPDTIDLSRYSDKSGEVSYLQVDVSIENQISMMVEAAVSRWGRLDIMVANAGISGLGRAEDISWKNWHQVLEINLSGVFYCTKFAIPEMRKVGQGAIINTASVMGLVAPRGAASYAATKGAVINFTRATAVDYAAEGIRVNAVCPGHLDTAMKGGAVAKQRDNQELLRHYPMGRLGRPAEVASAIAFLASDESSFITGTTLTVDGGYTAV